VSCMSKRRQVFDGLVLGGHTRLQVHINFATLLRRSSASSRMRSSSRVMSGIAFCASCVASSSLALSSSCFTCNPSTVARFAQYTSLRKGGQAQPSSDKWASSALPPIISLTMLAIMVGTSPLHKPSAHHHAPSNDCNEPTLKQVFFCCHDFMCLQAFSRSTADCTSGCFCNGDALSQHIFSDVCESELDCLDSLKIRWPHISVRWLWHAVRELIVEENHECPTWNEKSTSLHDVSDLRANHARKNSPPETDSAQVVALSLPRRTSPTASILKQTGIIKRRVKHKQTCYHCAHPPRAPDRLCSI
jgi:hypothetical protein